MSSESHAVTDSVPNEDARQSYGLPWAFIALVILTMAPVVVGVVQFNALLQDALFEPALSTQAASQLEEMLQAARSRMLWVGVVAIIGVAALSYSIRRRRKVSLRSIGVAVDRLRDGDLTHSEALDTELRAAGVVGEVGQRVADVSGGLRTMVRQLRDSVAQLSGTTSGVATTSQQAAATASEQAATVSQVTTTTEEILQTSTAAAQTAQRVVETSEQAVQRGQSGLTVVEDAARVMDVINARVSEIATKILTLSEQNSLIGDIVETVNGLAEQSNLLAVNASIEAAKAGDQGRGFAVVAAEVRNLAEQSKRSTDQIRTIIEDVQHATQGAVMAAEEGSKRAEDGRSAIVTVREVIGGLAGVLEENADMARQIAGAASQQAAGVEEISRAMQSVNDAGSDTAKGARALAASADSLSSIAHELEGLVGHYKI